MARFLSSIYGVTSTETIETRRMASILPNDPQSNARALPSRTPVGGRRRRPGAECPRPMRKEQHFDSPTGVVPDSHQSKIRIDSPTPKFPLIGPSCGRQPPHRPPVGGSSRFNGRANGDGRLFTCVPPHATNPGFPNQSRKEAPITTLHDSHWAGVNASGSSRGHFAPRGDQSL